MHVSQLKAPSIQLFDSAFSAFARGSLMSKPNGQVAVARSIAKRRIKHFDRRTSQNHMDRIQHVCSRGTRLMDALNQNYGLHLWPIPPVILLNSLAFGKFVTNATSFSWEQ
jgi:hypothetical protein